MITNHSAAIYSLNMACRYYMNDFKEVKTHKKTGAVFSSAESNHFKRVFIDTELSTAFRHEVWFDDVFYSIEVPIIAYSLNAKKMKRLTHFNVDFKVIVLKDNVYNEYVGVIVDDKNFTLKDGAITQNYMIEYGKEVFDFHKEEIVQLVKDGKIVNNFGIIRLYNESFVSDMFLP